MLASILTNVKVFTSKCFILFIFVCDICLWYIYEKIYNEKHLQIVLWTLKEVSKHLNKCEGTY